jgi:hypothetical protein
VWQIGECKIHDCDVEKITREPLFPTLQILHMDVEAMQMRYSAIEALETVCEAKGQSSSARSRNRM